MKAISDRSLFLLWLIDQDTEKDWSTGRLKSFFVPKSSAIYYRDNGKDNYTYVSGAGDASALRGLENKGFIERPKTALPNKYVYALTEEGLKFVIDNELRNRFK